jgi:tetratricopeptide (TPR) repeat protein
MRRRLSVIGFCSLAFLVTACSTTYWQVRRGERLYDAGRYRESYEAFRGALQASGDPALQYSVGNALYRMRRYEEAAKSFREAAGIPRLRHQSSYNLGNAYVRAAEDGMDKDRLCSHLIPRPNGTWSWPSDVGERIASPADRRDAAARQIMAGGT